MTQKGTRWKASYEKGWIERFREKVGPKLVQHFPLPADELPEFLVEKLRRLTRVEGAAMRGDARNDPRGDFICMKMRRRA
jgi:hypothetical protein